MKVLITGCSGFIGHHLIKACHDKRWKVVGIDKRPLSYRGNLEIKFIQIDVNDLGFRDLMDVDAVIHLAFSTNIPNSIRHPEVTTRQNIDMSIHLLEVCKDAGVKGFVFPSTASLYGDNPTPWTEDMPVVPFEPYSWQKLAIEQACQMYATQYGVPTVVLRFFQVFGELQRSDTALAAFMKAKEENREVTLTKTMAQSKFKSGQRDFVYAGDVAKAIVAAVESNQVGNGEIINICSGEFITMEDVVVALGAKVKWIPKRPYEVERHHGDNKKARMLLNWKPEVEVIDWLKENSYEKV